MNNGTKTVKNKNNNKPQLQYQQIPKARLKSQNILNSEQSSSPSFDFSNTQDFWEDDLHNNSNLIGLNNYEEYSFNDDDFDIYSESIFK